jgi:antitoxin YefM
MNENDTTHNSEINATMAFTQSLATILKKNLPEITLFHYLYLSLYSETYKTNNIMLTTTISDFRKDIKQYLDRVTENFETLIINRGKDSGVVIMSLDEYNSLNATYHELSSKTNEKRLDSAIEKLKTGSSFQKDLLEL